MTLRRAACALPTLALALMGCPSKDGADTGDTGDSGPAGAVDADHDGFPEVDDCDDDDPDSFPGATEVCDGVDNDCDGVPDDGAGVVAFRDADHDGWGDPGSATTACETPESYVTQGGDCDDGEPGVNPAADEVCNGRDDDCAPETVDAEIATFFPAGGGAAEDWTDAMTPGTRVNLDHEGILGLCPGTWQNTLVITADVVVGSPIPDSPAELAGDGDGTVVLVAGDGLDVTLSNVSIKGGRGDTATTGTAGDGGGIACVGTGTADVQLTVSRSAVIGNEATFGGGIYAERCDLALDAVEIADNVADVGGGLAAVDGSHEIGGGSRFSGNVATEGGGGILAFGVNERAQLTMGAVTLDGNRAESYGGGAALLSSDVRWAPTSGEAYTHSNTDGSGAGGLYLYDSTLQVAGVGFGTADGGTDNTPYDLYVDEVRSPYVAPEAATFSCGTAGCGASEAHTVGGIVYGLSNDYILLNVARATRQVTIDGVAAYMTVGESCTVAMYVMSRDSASSGTWRMEWNEHTMPGAGRTQWYSSGRIGLVTEPGRYYATGAGWDCDGGVSYYFDYYYTPTTDDMGFGTSEGYVWGSTGLATSDLSLTYVNTPPIFATRVFTTEL